MSCFLRQTKGSVVTLFALTLPVLLGLGALAVDIGHFYLERRALQGASDAAALAAVSDPGRSEVLVREMLTANGYPNADFRLERGNYVADENRHRNERFVIDGQGAAVRLHVSTGTRLFLGQILTSEPPTVSVHSDAHREVMVSISAGSRLAQLDGGVVNGVLGVIGGGLSLSAVDYKGLADVGLRLGPLLDNVVRLAQIPVVAGTVNDVLDHEISLQVVLRAMAQGLRDQRRSALASRLEHVAHEGVAVRTRVKLGDTVELDESLRGVNLGYPAGALAAEVSALSLVTAMLTGRDIGNALELRLPLVEAELSIGEGMQTAHSMAIGGVGAEIEAAQVRLQAKIGDTIMLVGQSVGLNLPLEAVVAGGRAWVTEISCAADPANHRVVVAVQPGVAKLEIGEYAKPISTASVHGHLPPARLLHIDLEVLGIKRAVSVAINVAARAPIVEGRPSYHTFTGSQIGNGHTKTARTNNFTNGLVDSLLRDLSLSPTVLVLIPIPLPVDALVAPLFTPIRVALRPLTSTIDELLNAVLGLAGVGLGEMDVRVDSIICDNGRIVG